MTNPVKGILPGSRWEEISAGTARDFGDDMPTVFYGQGNGFLVCRGPDMTSDQSVKVADGGQYPLLLSRIADTSTVDVLVVWNTIPRA